MITIPSPAVAQSLIVYDQVKRHHSLSFDEIKAGQLMQIRRLLTHAMQSSVFWKQRIYDAGIQAETMGWDEFYRLPILTRPDAQTYNEALKCHWPSRKDTDIHTVTTSGSTGIPLKVDHYIPVYNPIYSAQTHLDDLIHQRDATRPFCAMGQTTKDHEQWGWTPMHHFLGARGKASTRELVTRKFSEHLDWLVDRNPSYLRSAACYAADLANLALERGIKLNIHQVLSTGEAVHDNQRAIIKEAFGAKVVDRYSCEEVGWIAQQCPINRHYHVASSSVVVEIVDDKNEACRPGEVGRVLLTGLFSYAMPLIRYEIGDLAEWGEGSCSCGSQHPIIRHIRGRIRERLMLPDGETVPMSCLGHEIARIDAVRAFQIRQYTDQTIELLVELRSGRTLTSEDYETVRSIFDRNQCQELPLHVKPIDKIDWGNGFKRKEFVLVNAVYTGTIPSGGRE